MVRELENGYPKSRVPFDRVRKIIWDKKTELKLKLAQISRAVGKKDTYIYDYFFKHSPASLPQDVRMQLAAFLGIPEEDIRSVPLPVPPNPAFGASVPQPRPAPGAAVRDVPLYTETDRIEGGTAHDFALRPPQLDGIGGCWAVWISKDYGRLCPGDMAYVRPTQPARQGDTVLLLAEGHVLAGGRLVSQGPKGFVLDVRGHEEAFPGGKIARVVVIVPA